MELLASYSCPICRGKRHSLNELEELFAKSSDEQNALEFFIDIEQWFSGKTIYGGPK